MFTRETSYKSTKPAEEYRIIQPSGSSGECTHIQPHLSSFGNFHRIIFYTHEF